MWRRPVQGPAGFAGVSVTPAGVSIVRLVCEPERPPRVGAWEWHPVDAPGSVAIVLAERVRSLELAGVPCCFALAPEATSLQLAAAPPVRDEELADAARWLVKDLVDFPVESAAVAVGGVPHAPGSARARRVLVEAARGDRVREIEALAEASGLVLTAVIGHESALLATARTGAEPERNVAMLELGDKSALILVGRNERLCMARRLASSAPEVEAALPAPGDEAGAELHEQGLEDLLLEIQRSLDFYESEFGLGPVTDLLIAPADSEVGELVPHLAAALAPTVRAIEMDSLADGSTVPTRMQARVLPALGAALVAAGAHAPSLWRRREVEPASRVGGAQGLRVLAAAALVIALAHGFERVRTARAEREAERLESAAAAADVELDALRKRVAALAEDPALTAELRALTSERDAALLRLEALASPPLSQQREFPLVLNALAEQIVPGVWLREIRVTEGGRRLDLVGSAESAERVPHFVGELAGHPGLVGLEFHRLHLERPEDDAGRVDFELRGGSEEDGT